MSIAIIDCMPFFFYYYKVLKIPLSTIFNNLYFVELPLNQDEKEMLTLWLADKFIDAVKDEQERDLCNDAIIIAQEKIKTL